LVEHSMSLQQMLTAPFNCATGSQVYPDGQSPPL
jgi:hypothetical protein